MRLLWAFLLALPLAAQFRGWPPLPREAMELLLKGDAAGSVALLRASAAAGDAVAMFWLGRSLEEVEGVPHDYAEAMRWYRKASDAGLGVASWSAGRLHEMGRGAARDLDEARRWYAKAAELGFRRTALTVVKARLYPGAEELAYEPAPQAVQTVERRTPDIEPGELDALRQAGVRGRLVWQGGEPGMFGLSARVILIARSPVAAEVRLAAAQEGSLIYVQNEGGWRRLGGGAAAERVLRVHPQSPDVPWITSVTLEMEDGGTQSTSGWAWERP